MNKKFFKLLIIFTVLLSILTVTSFATSDDATTTSNSENETTTSENTEATEENTTENEENSEEGETQTHEGDLYVEEDTVDITEDQYIAGNAYIKGKEVTISGQIDGNLYVQCDKLTLNKSYIRNSIFVVAKEIYYDGFCNDLYAVCDNMEMTYDSYIIRNMNAIVNSNLVFKTAVGVNANIKVGGNIDFGADDDVALVCGNLKLDSKSDITPPDKVVEGEFTNDKDAVKDIKVLKYMKNGDFFFDRYYSKTAKNVIYVVLAVVAVIIIALIVIFCILPKIKSKKKDTVEDSGAIQNK